MSVCPLPDLELKKLLKTWAFHSIKYFISWKASLELLRFQSALALQCYTNEYIYNNTEKEQNLHFRRDRKKDFQK